MIKTIFIDHSKRSSVPKRSQELYRNVRDSGRKPNVNGKKSSMATVIICHKFKTPGHKKKDCNQLNKRPDKSGNLENSKNKCCTYHRSNGHSNGDCSLQQSKTKSGKFCNNIKIWCHYHKSASHSNNGCYYQRGSEFYNSSSIDGKISGKRKTFNADSTPTGCDAKFCCNYKMENNSNESNDESYPPPPGIRFTFAACHLPLSQQIDIFQILVDLGFV